MKQVTDIRCGPETKSLKLVDLIPTADIGDYMVSLGCEVRGHRRSHAAKADKSDLAKWRLAPSSRFRTTGLLAGSSFGCPLEG
jgi:hypothetical protein